MTEKKYSISLADQYAMTAKEIMFSNSPRFPPALRDSGHKVPQSPNLIPLLLKEEIGESKQLLQLETVVSSSKQESLCNPTELMTPDPISGTETLA